MIEEYSLFGKSVKLDGTLFFINGVVHETPWTSISKEFKQAINNSLKGKNILCEDGLTEWFEEAESFNEADYFEFNKISFFQYLNVFKEYLKFKHFAKPINRPNLIKKVESLKDLSGLREIRAELFSNYFPEPKGMNNLMLKYGNGNIKNPVGELPMRIKRYAYEANESIKYAKRKSLDELHLVVGCAHELPLEYLLTHSNELKALVANMETFK